MLPTDEQLNEGLEGRDPSPEQSAVIAELRQVLLDASIRVRDNVQDNAFARRALSALQQAFSFARNAVVAPPDLPPKETFK